MAIATREDRQSVVGIVTPNVLKDVEWREQVVEIYSGIGVQLVVSGGSWKRRRNTIAAATRRVC